VPAEQFRQDDEPLVALYLPALHGMHCVIAASCMYPTLQLQFRTPLLPSFENENAGQLAQAELFCNAKALEYFPAVHALQVLTPSADENVPGRQLVHGDEPLLGLNVPEPHGKTRIVTTGWPSKDTLAMLLFRAKNAALSED
jgi:hypothetical protein